MTAPSPFPEQITEKDVLNRQETKCEQILRFAKIYFFRYKIQQLSYIYFYMYFQMRRIQIYSKL